MLDDGIVEYPSVIKLEQYTDDWSFLYYLDDGTFVRSRCVPTNVDAMFPAENTANLHLTERERHVGVHHFIFFEVKRREPLSVGQERMLRALVVDGKTVILVHSYPSKRYRNEENHTDPVIPVAYEILGVTRDKDEWHETSQKDFRRRYFEWVYTLGMNVWRK